jgi:hypothetical protein
VVSDGPAALSPRSNTAQFFQGVVFDLAPPAVPTAPAAPLVQLVELRPSGAQRSLFRVPIALRYGFSPGLFDVEPVDSDHFASLELAVDYRNPERQKDKLAIKFSVAVPEGKVLAGQTVSVDVGGHAREFTLDSKGKADKKVTGKLSR